MNATPTYNGKEANAGDIIAGDQYEGEGYAELTCGNTTVRLGYTSLHRMASSMAGVSPSIRGAIDAIVCEAMQGRTPDATPANKPSIERCPDRTGRRIILCE